MKNKKTVDTILNLFFILIDSMTFLLRIKTHKNYWSFKKYWIYLEVYGLFILEKLETGLSLVSAENLFVNTKLRLGLS